MSKKFILALHGTPNLRDPITRYCADRKWRVWHWYADLWLLSDVYEGLTAGAVYKEIRAAVPDLPSTCFLVLEMGPDLRYYGTAPLAEAWDWMKNNWGTADIPKADG